VGKPTKTAPPPPQTGSESERRRVGKVVHDDRGNALVEWEGAPADYQRVVLEVVNDGRSQRKDEEAFNPYAQRVPRERGSTGNATRTDLRKLSEWIKKMRELEERKRDGDGQDQDQDPD
jgi:hypothetical protein